MKKILLINFFCLLFVNIIFGQATLPAVEHFNYSAGELRTVGTNWTRISGTKNDLYVVEGNLTYTNYPMSATGRQVQITSSGADDDKFSFTTQSADGIKVYASFLLNVTNTTGLGAGAYFAMLGTGSISFTTRLFIRLDGTGFNLGLARNSGTVGAWGSTTLSVGETYLIVLGYEIVSGTYNDIARVWINPNLSGVEPSATLTVGETDGDMEISGFYIRQTSGTPNATIDALRIALSWDLAPLPVELTSFTAKFIGGKINLNWSTATEVNNFGFEVERSLRTEVGNQKSEWEKIGFVPGHGNSNSVKEYSFTDDFNHSIRYRLKQIDNDGTFAYSKEVEVLNSKPSTYQLSQNFPNPFNPSTVISYQLPVSAQVSLKVYDVLGNEVASLVNLQQEAGSYNVTLDASTLASGTYIYRLIAGDNVAVKKLVILK
ncbi:MAG: T9SS type A sorting domain-containing protein [Ignavibacteriaceae bacterium]